MSSDTSSTWARLEKLLDKYKSGVLQAVQKHAEVLETVNNTRFFGLCSFSCSVSIITDMTLQLLNMATVHVVGNRPICEIYKRILIL